jgi:hypothetical protein
MRLQRLRVLILKEIERGAGSCQDTGLLECESLSLAPVQHKWLPGWMSLGGLSLSRNDSIASWSCQKNSPHSQLEVGISLFYLVRQQDEYAWNYSRVLY